MTDETNTANIQDHMAYTHHCGSVKFNLLKSGRVECDKCGQILAGFRWTNANRQASK